MLQWNLAKVATPNNKVGNERRTGGIQLELAPSQPPPKKAKVDTIKASRSFTPILLCFNPLRVALFLYNMCLFN